MPEFPLKNHNKSLSEGYSQETYQKSQGRKKLRDLTEIHKTWTFDPQVWIKIQQFESKFAAVMVFVKTCVVVVLTQKAFF